MKTKVKVIRVKGERAAQRKAQRMLRHGWELQNQSTRKSLFSGPLGILTRKQIHTLTFVKRPQEKPPAVGSALSS